LTSSPRRPSPASRAVRRSRRPAPRQASFLERYRTRLLWIGGIALVGGLAFAGLILPSITPVYACSNVFDPTPAPSWTPPPSEPLSSGETPGPAATPPPPGFVQPDMGRNHVTVGTKVTYTWCPPASGRHYSAQGEGPIPAGVYGPGDPKVPQNWVHNLEHGNTVLLYKCPGEACSDQGQAALDALFSRWPNTPICNTPKGTFNPVIARFDDMPWPYAALVWDLVLPLQTLDEQQLFAFQAGQAERNNPEKQCPQPTPTPGPPTPTPAPTPTSAPTGTPAPSGTGPASTAAPAGSPSPAAS
jgi:hypothetical protein